MKQISWNLIDEMDPASEAHDRIKEHSIFSKLVDKVYGHLTEVEGNFEIEMCNGSTLEYNYVFKPYGSNNPNTDYIRVRKSTGEVENLDFETFFGDEYVPNYGCMIMSALMMYTEHILKIRDNSLKA